MKIAYKHDFELMYQMFATEKYALCIIILTYDNVKLVLSGSSEHVTLWLYH